MSEDNSVKDKEKDFSGMTLIFDKEGNNPNDLWTTERLKEELFLCLATVTEIVNSTDLHSFGKHITVKKYYRQARDIMYFIPVFRPTPVFVIKFSDLSPKLQMEFTDFCKANNQTTITLFLKEIAGRFFENLDYAYYHGSVMKCLRVRLVS
jgi:hypothetical protein